MDNGITEEIEHSIMKWGELIELVDKGKVKLVNTTIEEIKEHLDGINTYISTDKYEHAIRVGEITDSYSVDESYVIVYDENNEPITIIYVSELKNVTSFCGILICSGHEDLVCYNLDTREFIS